MQRRDFLAGAAGWALGAAFPAAAQPDGRQFFCTFERSPTEGGFRLQAREPGRASIVPVGRDGGSAVRLRTEPGDDNINGSRYAERCDLALPRQLSDGFEGREHWWAVSILFPDDYVPPLPKGWGAAMEFHNSEPGPGQANFFLMAGPHGLEFRGHGGRQQRDGRYGERLGPVERNQWYDFVYHVRWSAERDGFMHAWVNGRKRLSHRGPTLYAGQGCYLKLSNYHSPSGQPSSIIHDRVIRGGAAEDVALTRLE